MMKHVQRVCVAAFCGLLLAAGALIATPVAAADGCAPGFNTNVYNGQCYSPNEAPTINGVPCVASNLGLCSSFQQNQQPPRRPSSSIG